MSNRAVVLIAALAATVAAPAGRAGVDVPPGQLQPPRSPTPAAPAPTPSSYNPSAGDAGENHGDVPAETQEAAWGPVADRFARNFTNTRGGAEKWRQRLAGDPAHPDVTTAVVKQLATVDVRNVPDGRYEGREVLKSSDYDLAVKVTYREGWAMVLYLVTDGTGWQVYAYDKWEA